jgi:hypothetical protein
MSCMKSIRGGQVRGGSIRVRSVRGGRIGVHGGMRARMHCKIFGGKKSPKSCSPQTQKKYVTRPGPPYPAQECKGQIKLGNDKKEYISKAASNGIYRWQRTTKSPKTK